MLRLNTLLKSLNVLNVLLLAAILLFGQYVLLPLLNVTIAVAPLPAKGKPAQQSQAAPAPGSELPPPPALMEFTVIAEQNLFHPDRKIPPAKTAEAPVPRPEFVLYGTLIADNLSLAYLSDKKAPRTTPGRGQRQTPLKVGDSLSGYTLKEILHQKVVMARGDDRVEVKVISTDKSKARTPSAGVEGAGPHQGFPEEGVMQPQQPMPQQPQPPLVRPQPQRPPLPNQPGGPGTRKPSTWRF